MKISLAWLKTYLDLPQDDINTYSDLLIQAGIEVEKIHYRGVNSEQIIVAQIVEIQPHPDARKLKICRVNDGTPNLRQIVCGAKNYQLGDKVPLALPGAKLSQDFEIKSTSVRGVESLGMLCAADEINLTDDQEGLMILEGSVAVGTPLKEIFAPDVVLEIEVTPNRGDLLSHYGLAREFSALMEQPLLNKKEVQSINYQAPISLSIQDTTACPYYSLAKISGVKIKESPTWLKNNLLSVGITPINNVVDITNYILHDQGQPLHAFDTQKIQGKISIQQLAEKTHFLALDQKSYSLEPHDLIVVDESNETLALAGIIGGERSCVTSHTSEITLEAAQFDPVQVRRTSSRLYLHSDSSYRFERGIDPELTHKAFNEAIALIIEITGGSLEQAERLSVDNLLATKTSIKFNQQILRRYLGEDMTYQQASSILERISCLKQSDDSYTVPSYRLDLTRSVDLLEEVVRIHGFEKFSSKRVGWLAPESSVDREYDYQFNVSSQLAAQGLFEVKNLKLISPEKSDLFLPLKPLGKTDLIHIPHPLGLEQSILRPSLIPGLLDVASHNLRQGSKQLAYFEIGLVFQNIGKTPDVESPHLGILLSGESTPIRWDNSQPKSLDFYDLKAIIQSLIPRNFIEFKAKKHPHYFGMMQIKVANKDLGLIAQIPPVQCRSIDNPYPAFVAELNINTLWSLQTSCPAVTPLQFPTSVRDLSLELPKKTPYSSLEIFLDNLESPLLKSWICFDYFYDLAGIKLAVNKNSLSFRFTYQSKDKTLKLDEVNTAHQKIRNSLLEKFPEIIAHS